MLVMAKLYSLRGSLKLYEYFIKQFFSPFYQSNGLFSLETTHFVVF